MPAWTTSLDQRVVARLKMLESMQAHLEMMHFTPGQRVSFAHQGGRLLGTVVKCNRKTVTVWLPTMARAGMSHPIYSRQRGTLDPSRPNSRPLIKNDSDNQAWANDGVV